MLAQQRVHRRYARTTGRGVVAVGLNQKVTVGPRRQWRVHQTSARIQGGEIDRGAGAVQIREEYPQTVRQRLLAAHACDGMDRDACGLGSLLDRTGQQGVRCRLAENSVTVFQRRLDRRCEAHGLP